MCSPPSLWLMDRVLAIGVVLSLKTDDSPSRDPCGRIVSRPAFACHGCAYPSSYERVPFKTLRLTCFMDVCAYDRALAAVFRFSLARHRDCLTIRFRHPTPNDANCAILSYYSLVSMHHSSLTRPPHRPRRAIRSWFFCDLRFVSIL